MLDSRPISKESLSQPCSLESAHHTQPGRRLPSPIGKRDGGSGRWVVGVVLEVKVGELSEGKGPRVSRECGLRGGKGWEERVDWVSTS